jgi:hypothetical protein
LTYSLIVIAGHVPAIHVGAQNANANAFGTTWIA